MVRFAFMCCYIKEAERGQNDPQQAGEGQVDSEHAAQSRKEGRSKGDCI